MYLGFREKKNQNNRAACEEPPRNSSVSGISCSLEALKMQQVSPEFFLPVSAAGCNTQRVCSALPLSAEGPKQIKMRAEIANCAKT